MFNIGSGVPPVLAALSAQQPQMREVDEVERLRRKYRSTEDLNAHGDVSGSGVRVVFFVAPVAIQPDPDGPVTTDPRLHLAKFIVGDASTVAVSQISEKMAKAVYPDEYEAYTSAPEIQATGTPISDLWGLSASQVGKALALNIMSIEDAAALPETRIAELGFEIRAVHERAKAWLKSRENAGEAIDSADEIAQLRERLQRLEAEKEAIKADRDAATRALDMAAKANGTPAPTTTVAGQSAVLKEDNSAGDALPYVSYDPMVDDDPDPIGIAPGA